MTFLRVNDFKEREMSFMKAHLDQILKDLNLDGFEIKIHNKRCKYPTANIYPNMNPPLIVIEANKPSLIRYAMTNLLLHEQAHYKLLNNYPDYNGDHHNHPRFLEIEKELNKVIDDLILMEHD